MNLRVWVKKKFGKLYKKEQKFVKNWKKVKSMYAVPKKWDKEVKHHLI